MAGNTLCPSAAALIGVIHDKMTTEEQTHLNGIVKAHTNFVYFTNQFPSSRDRSIAITHAEEAFARALKGIADEILKSKE